MVYLGVTLCNTLNQQVALSSQVLALVTTEGERKQYTLLIIYSLKTTPHCNLKLVLSHHPRNVSYFHITLFSIDYFGKK